MTLRTKALLILIALCAVPVLYFSGKGKDRIVIHDQEPRRASVSAQDTLEMKARWNTESPPQERYFPPAFQEDIAKEEEDVEEEGDSEIAKSFVFATPLADFSAASASTGPAATLVREKGDDVSVDASSGDGDGDAADANGNAVIQILDALRELEGLGANRSSLIGGMRVRGSSADADSSRDDKEKESEEAEDDALMPHYDGQARGFMILPLMQPNARESVEKQIETLIQSQLINVYVSFLVDGSFSTNFEYASSVVQRLGSDGRNLTMQVFFINGPAQRRIDSPIETVFNIDPIDFRYDIQESAYVKAEYKKLVSSAKALFIQNKNSNAGNKNIACVMLEDNLDLPAYRTMRQLTYSVLGDVTDYVRNPCPNCGVEGSDDDPDGDGLERHDPNLLSELGPRDGLALDGVGYNYPSETGAGSLSYEQVQQLAKNSATQGIRYLALWRAGRQGLGDGGQSVHPDDRVYDVPSEQQVQLDIQVLQAGLTAVR